MASPPYLVFFVRDEVDDDIAGAVCGAVRSLASSRAWPGTAPGWFDDPDAPQAADRTTGCYLRVEDLASDEAAAVLAAARQLSAELEIVLEVQWRERTLGELRAGAASGALESLL